MLKVEERPQPRGSESGSTLDRSEVLELLLREVVDGQAPVVVARDEVHDVGLHAGEVDDAHSAEDAAEDIAAPEMRLGDIAEPRDRHVGGRRLQHQEFGGEEIVFIGVMNIETKTILKKRLMRFNSNYSALIEFILILRKK